jgi:hypothetical protein
MKKYRVLFTVLAILISLLLVCLDIVFGIWLYDFIFSIREVKVLTADFGVSAILAIVAAAIAAATAIGTGTASAVQADKAELKADTQKAKNDSWFNKEYYQDSLNKKENQEMLSELSKVFGNDAKTQGATSNILGISPDTARQMNLQGNEAYSSAVGNIKSNEDKFKGSLLDNYNQKDMDYNNAKMATQQQKANALAGIFTGVASTIGEVAGVVSSSSNTTSSTTTNNTSNEIKQD